MNLQGLTVRELLKLPILEQARLVSGEKGLDRVVRYVDIMEVPDIRGWLREGELILTTGYSTRHDPALLPELVELLAQANAAGVAIKPERFIPDIPKEMIEKSNQYDIPIIQLPVGIPYIDITYAVMERILDKQAALLRRSEEVYKTLTNLVLTNSGIQVVADNVAELVKSPIWVIGRSGDILVSSPRQTPYEPSPRNRHWEVTVDKQFMGKLIVGKEQLDELELVCVEQARLVFSLELMRKKIAEDTEARLRGNFLEELLTGMPLSVQEAENKGRQLGLDPGWSWEIGVVEGEQPFTDYESPFLLELNPLLQQASAGLKVRSHVQLQAGRLILFLPSVRMGDAPRKKQEPERASGWAGLLQPLLRRWGTLRCGFGSPCSLWEVHRGYREAQKALRIGIRLHKERQLFAFGEVELFDLMLETSDPGRLNKLVQRNIGKLYEHDKEHGTELVTTLYHYLAAGGSLIEAANRLYIHRNSVKYRMDRIKEMTGMDLDSASSRFELYLCTVYSLLNRTD